MKNWEECRSKIGRGRHYSGTEWQRGQVSVRVLQFTPVCHATSASHAVMYHLGADSGPVTGRSSTQCNDKRKINYFPSICLERLSKTAKDIRQDQHFRGRKSKTETPDMKQEF